MKSTLSAVLLLLPAITFSGSWGWGMGVVDSCEELKEILQDDMTSIAFENLITLESKRYLV